MRGLLLLGTFLLIFSFAMLVAAPLRMRAVEAEATARYLSGQEPLVVTQIVTNQAGEPVIIAVTHVMVHVLTPGEEATGTSTRTAMPTATRRPISGGGGSTGIQPAPATNTPRPDPTSTPYVLPTISTGGGSTGGGSGGSGGGGSIATRTPLPTLRSTSTPNLPDPTDTAPPPETDTPLPAPSDAPTDPAPTDMPTDPPPPTDSPTDPPPTDPPPPTEGTGGSQSSRFGGGARAKALTQEFTLGSLAAGAIIAIFAYYWLRRR
jgi:hypothetical protein